MRLRVLSVAVAGLALGCASASAASPASVDPMIGTGGAGGTFPGATVPFGMVQPSPNTEHALGGGYDYGHPVTWGFGTTHLSGPGCPALGDVVLLPTSGPVTHASPRAYESRFDHTSEVARPGYYSVLLERSGVRAELTATDRSAWERYTYPSSAEAGVLVAPGAGLRGAWAASVRRVGRSTIAGSVGSWGYFGNCTAKTLNRYTVHFIARFSRPFASTAAGSGGRLREGATSAEGPKAAMHVSFGRLDAPVVVEVAISYVSQAGATANLRREAAGLDFDEVGLRAERRWQRLLGRVRVEGGTAAQRTTFDTALYHALLHPNLLSDVDGRYVGFDGAVHRSGSLPQYTNFSLWDTYRGEQQLLDLVVPGLVPAFATSLLRDYEQSGWLPKWPYAVYETNEMIGDPAVPVLVDAYLKGLLPAGRVQEAYAAMVHDATAVPPPGSPFVGRVGLASDLAFGYVPVGYGDLASGAAMTLEYAVDDCALSLAAEKVGDPLGAAVLVSRAQSYRNLVDSSRFMRPRDLGGNFVVPFDPTSGHGFREGNAWQYTWLVPQDVPGLAEMIGGVAAAAKKLDDFFAGGFYDAGNELDLQAPYLYDYLGRPWRTQQVVAGELRRYEPVPDGIPGNDDLGSLSAWYVLGALGLYPVLGGGDTYALTAPLFPKATLEIGGKRNRTVVIERRGQGLISGATLDGEPWSRPWISDADLRGGATLAYRLAPAESSPWGTDPADAPPAACGASVDVGHVAFAFDPNSRIGIARDRQSILTTNVANDRDVTVTDVSARLELPDGWTAQTLEQTIDVLAPHTTRRLEWAVTPPPGFTGDQRLRASVTWSTAAGRSPLMAAPAEQDVTVR